MLTDCSSSFDPCSALFHVLTYQPRVNPAIQPRRKPAVPSHLPQPSFFLPISILTRATVSTSYLVLNPTFASSLLENKDECLMSWVLVSQPILSSSYINHLLTLLPIQNAAPSPSRHHSLSLWQSTFATATNAVANPPPHSAALPSSLRSLYLPPSRGL